MHEKLGPRLTGYPLSVSVNGAFLPTKDSAYRIRRLRELGDDMQYGKSPSVDLPLLFLVIGALVLIVAVPAAMAASGSACDSVVKEHAQYGQFTLHCIQNICPEPCAKTYTFNGPQGTWRTCGCPSAYIPFMCNVGMPTMAGYSPICSHTDCPGTAAADDCKWQDRWDAEQQANIHYCDCTYD